jgi:hypothetical protein
MRIHAIDIVQPPGIDIPPIVDIDAQPTIVIAALAMKINAELAKNSDVQDVPVPRAHGCAGAADVQDVPVPRAHGCAGAGRA